MPAQAGIHDHQGPARKCFQALLPRQARMPACAGMRM
jgi:hypothetical protein